MSRSLYCPDCDLIYDEYVETCPTCQGEVVTWRDDYLERDPRRGSLKTGVLILIALHALQLILLGVQDGTSMLLFFGFTQFLYVVPAMIVVAIKGKSATLGGIALGAGLTLVVNVAVFGLVCASMLEGGWH